MAKTRRKGGPTKGEAEILQLPGGMTAILQENHDTPVVSILFFVKVGSADESDGQMGLAHLHEHMIFKGTPTRPVGRIAAEVEGAGGEINAYTTFDHTCYYVTIASRYWRVGMEVLVDALRNAAFDEKELAKELRVIYEEMARSNDSPAQRVGENLLKTMYKTHPYRRPIIGSRKVLETITRKEILQFFRRYYTPSNMLLVIAGDFEAGKAGKRLRSLFAAARDKGVRHGPRPTEKPQRRPRVTLEFADVQEATLELGFHGPSLFHRDAVTGDLVAMLLGGGDSSRLHKRIKRRRLVYDAFSDSCSLENPGFFILGAVCEPRKAKKAVCALIEELSRLRTKPIRLKELERVRAIMESWFLYELETPTGLARKLAFSYLHFHDLRFDERYLNILSELGREDVLRFAQKYLSPQKASLSLLAPNSQRGRIKAADFYEALSPSLRPVSGKMGLGTSSKSKVAAPILLRATRGAKRRVKMAVLENGIRLIVKESTQAPIVSIKACLMAGTRQETARNAGVSRTVASLLTKGTRRMSADEFAEVVESMAGAIVGFSGRNSLGLSGDFLSRHFERGYELMADSLLSPSFVEKEIDLLRYDLLAALARREDHLAHRCVDLFQELLFQKHPYGRSTLGTEKSIKAMTRGRLRSFHRRIVRPRNLVIAVAGDLSFEQALNATKAYFGGLKDGDLSLITPPAERSWKGPRRAVLRRDKEQAHLVIGFLGAAIGNRDRHALEVLGAVLSGQGGRLFLELRDRLHLAYTVSSFNHEGIEAGAFGFYIGTTHDNVEKAREGIWRQIESLRETPVGGRELEMAKRHMVGSGEIDMARLSTVAQSMALAELLGLSYREPFRMARRIEAVTPRRVQAAARRYLTPGAYVEALITR